mmetsp:Transcript_18751/g.56712  ORF Transcript_18751/g.56712 Transcript_18751/m.56712 type:complete len:379 (+) Transcript_18751:75-1211(+)
MGAAQSQPQGVRPIYDQQGGKLPYQSSPEETLARQQAERAAAEAYNNTVRRSAEDLESRPVYEWVLRRAAQKTRGVARVDLVRPRLPPVSDDGSLWRAGTGEGVVGYPQAGRWGSRGGGTGYSRMQRTEFGGGGTGSFASEESSILGFGKAKGARIKLMRCIDIGQSQEVDEKRVARVPGQKQRSSPFGAPITDPFDNGQLNQGMAAGGVLGRVAGAFKQQPAFRVWGARPLKPPLFSLGVGASLELDQAGLLPHMRVRFQDWATLKILPAPVVKLQKSFQVPNSTLSLRLRYECPLEAIEDWYRPPARLLVRLDNTVGSGIHLSPQGIDFDQRVVNLGQSTSIRFAGHAGFPRQIPVPEGRPLLETQVDRLGLKTSW